MNKKIYRTANRKTKKVLPALLSVLMGLSSLSAPVYAESPDSTGIPVSTETPDASDTAKPSADADVTVDDGTAAAQPAASPDAADVPESSASPEASQEESEDPVAEGDNDTSDDEAHVFSSDATGIIVSATADALPEGVEWKNVTVDAKAIDLEEGLASQFEEGTKLTEYSIAFMNGDAEFEPDGIVTVSMPMPEGAESAFVYHADKGTLTDMHGETDAENQSVVFVTSHFSNYLVSDKPATVADDAEKVFENDLPAVTLDDMLWYIRENGSVVAFIGNDNDPEYQEMLHYYGDIYDGSDDDAKHAFQKLDVSSVYDEGAEALAGFAYDGGDQGLIKAAFSDIADNATGHAVVVFSFNGTITKVSAVSEKLPDGMTMEDAAHNSYLVGYVPGSTIPVKRIGMRRRAASRTASQAKYLDGYKWYLGAKAQIQPFTAEISGIYTVDLWGADGDTDTNWTASDPKAGLAAGIGGQGGHTRADIYLKKGDTVYFGLGFLNQFSNKRSWNGGGMGWGQSYGFRAGGGGAAAMYSEDINGSADKPSTAQLADYVNNKDKVLLVAGGGGGAEDHIAVGHYDYRCDDGHCTTSYGGGGGGLSGGKGSAPVAATVGEPGTQTSGYAFGQGQDYPASNDNQSAGGGGGGWYGGYSTATAPYGSPNTGQGGSGGGGSGYINTSFRDSSGKTLQNTSTETGGHVNYSHDVSTNTTHLEQYNARAEITLKTADKYTLTVEYLKAGTNEKLHADTVSTYAQGAAINETAYYIPGYTLTGKYDFNPASAKITEGDIPETVTTSEFFTMDNIDSIRNPYGDNTFTGTMPAYNITVKIYYDYPALSVKYLDYETHQELAPESLQYIKTGTAYNVKSPEISGYLRDVGTYDTYNQATTDLTVDDTAAASGTKKDHNEYYVIYYVPIIKPAKDIIERNGMTVSKQDSDAGVQLMEKDKYTYSINWENMQHKDRDIIIKDKLPSQIEYIDGTASNGGTYDAASRTVTWTVHAPARTSAAGGEGSKGTVTFRVRVNDGVKTGTVDNEWSSNDCGDGRKDIKYCNVRKDPVISYTIVKSADPVDGSDVAFDQVITYYIDVTNTGNAAINHLAVVDYIPEHTGDSSDHKGNYPNADHNYHGEDHADGNYVSYLIDSLPVGGTARLKFKAAVTAQQKDATRLTITNFAYHGVLPIANPNDSDLLKVTDPNGDGDKSDGFRTNEVHHYAIGPKVDVIKSADPASGAQVSDGQTITYKIDAANSGTVNANWLRIADVIPEGTTYVDGSLGLVSDNTDSDNKYSWKAGNGFDVYYDTVSKQYRLENVAVAAGTNTIKVSWPSGITLVSGTYGNAAVSGNTVTLETGANGADITEAQQKSWLQGLRWSGNYITRGNITIDFSKHRNVDVSQTWTSAGTYMLTLPETENHAITYHVEAQGGQGGGAGKPDVVSQDVNVQNGGVAAVIVGNGGNSGNSAGGNGENTTVTIAGQTITGTGSTGGTSGTVVNGTWYELGAASHDNHSAPADNNDNGELKIPVPESMADVAQVKIVNVNAGTVYADFAGQRYTCPSGQGECHFDVASGNYAGQYVHVWGTNRTNGVHKHVEFGITKYRTTVSYAAGSAGYAKITGNDEWYQARRSSSGAIPSRSDSKGCAYITNNGSPYVECLTSDLGAGQKAHMEFQVTVNQGASASMDEIDNVALYETQFTNNDSYVGANRTLPGKQTNMTVHPLGKLSVAASKDSDPASGTTVQRGQTITYKVSIKNTGTTRSRYTHVRDYIPAETIYIAQSVSDGGAYVTGYDGGGNYVEWILDLAKGETKTVTFSVRVNDDALYNYKIVNEAMYQAYAENPGEPGKIQNNPANRTNQVWHQLKPPVKVNEADIVVEKSGSVSVPLGNAQAASGKTVFTEPTRRSYDGNDALITYTLRVAAVKASPDSKYIVVRDQIPEGTAFVENSFTLTNSATNKRLSPDLTEKHAYSKSGNYAEWVIENLNSNDFVDVSFTVKVNKYADLPAVGDRAANTVSNTAKYGFYKDNPGNPGAVSKTPGRSTNEVRTPLVDPHVKIVKSSNPATGNTEGKASDVKRRQIITYTLNVTNDSKNGVFANYAVVEDAIPANTTYVADSAAVKDNRDTAVFDRAANAVRYIVKDLAPGQTKTVAFKVQVNDATPKNMYIYNHALVKALITDPKTPIDLSEPTGTRNPDGGEGYSNQQVHKMTYIEPPAIPDPYKRVGGGIQTITEGLENVLDYHNTKDVNGTANNVQHSPFWYDIYQQIPAETKETYFSTFTVTDSIPSDILIDKITVYAIDGAGNKTNVTDQFEAGVTRDTDPKATYHMEETDMVMISAKPSWLKNAAAYGKTYQFHMTAYVSKKVVNDHAITKHEFINSAKIGIHYANSEIEKNDPYGAKDPGSDDKDPATRTTNTVKSTFVPKIPFVKHWTEEDSYYDERPSGITIHLLGSDGSDRKQVVTGGHTSEFWYYDFENIPAFDANGHRITYTMYEDDLDSYDSTAPKQIPLSVNFNDEDVITNMLMLDFPAIKNVCNKDHVDIDREIVLNGDELTYEITIENPARIAKKFDFEDVVPANTTYVSGSASDGGKYDPSTKKITWTNVTVAGSEKKSEGIYSSKTVSFKVKAVSNKTKWTEIDNVANVWMKRLTGDRNERTKQTTNMVINYIPLNDPPTTPNDTHKTVTTADGDDMNTKYVRKGDTLYYHVTIRNGIDLKTTQTSVESVAAVMAKAKTSKAKANAQAQLDKLNAGNRKANPKTYTLTDVIPENTVYVEGSADKGAVWSPKNKTLTWTLPIEAGKSITVSFAVKATDPDSDIKNHAHVAVDHVAWDTNTVTNQSATITIHKHLNQYYSQFGASPAFIYKITGSDGSENYRMVTCENGNDGYAVFEVPTGTADGVTWSVEELKQARYDFVSVEKHVNDNSAGFRLTKANPLISGIAFSKDKRHGEFTYSNTINYWGDYTGSDAVDNYVADGRHQTYRKQP